MKKQTNVAIPRNNQVGIKIGLEYKILAVDTFKVSVKSSRIVN